MKTFAIFIVALALAFDVAAPLKRIATALEKIVAMQVVQR